MIIKRSPVIFLSECAACYYAKMLNQTNMGDAASEWKVESNKCGYLLYREFYGNISGSYIEYLRR